MMEATSFIHAIETRQGIQIAALEEIAFINKWISNEELMDSANTYGKAPYGEHLKKVAMGKIKY
jgi:glucose-1-phosphate thymidylyltransferase